MRILQDLLAANLAGAPKGIVSVCSAHEGVLAATLARGARTGRPVLIEATCNQVNHHGGYTGLDPAAFRARVVTAASAAGLDPGLLLLGGDHLGPNPWRDRPAALAMAEASAMLRGYVQAGFRKLHLDTSMACAGDPDPLPPEIMASRAASLCAAAEELTPGEPVYVVGTEVPPPGGATHALSRVTPTEPSQPAETLALHRAAFDRVGLAHAMSRVVAVVVQPGVEFGADSVWPYDRAASRGLVAALSGSPGVVFEAHSTDYQSAAALAALVEDHFAILKVGPELTFAWREAALALDLIDAELHPAGQRAGLRTAIEASMESDPRWWRRHYGEGDRVGRMFGRSDRVRYYWPAPAVADAMRQLLASQADIPSTLVSQYLPRAADRGVSPRPAALLDDAVGQVLDRYAAAGG